jgi:hypothetical protein
MLGLGEHSYTEEYRGLKAAALPRIAVLARSQASRFHDARLEREAALRDDPPAAPFPPLLERRRRPGTIDDNGDVDDESRRDVYALLEEAKSYGIGLLFEADIDDEGNEAGWTISYVIHGWPAVQGQSADFPGDRLASAYDLETAVAAALKPLRELGQSYAEYLEQRA